MAASGLPAISECLQKHFPKFILEKGILELIRKAALG